MRRFGSGLAMLLTLAFAAAGPASSPAAAQPGGPCAGLPSNAELRGYLNNAASGNGVNAELGPGTTAGGVFGGSRMWGAIVNRQGELCAFITSTEDPTGVWPISQAIAKAKAYTANSVSLDDFVLSTARLHTLVQPGHSLYGLNNSNPFNPSYLAGPSQPGASGANHIAGGIITFGGGVPLYRDGRVVGGLGISGDTACADHEIAKRVRDLARLNPPGGPLVDDIVYREVDEASPFLHPLCPATLRNGVSLGDEATELY
jgi:uncharacterized protein GlcG (DUF336 family)